MSDPVKQFQMECKEEIERQGADEFLRNASVEWMREAGKYKYSYHFTWMGRPIIQHPEDIVAMQELIWKVKPDVIIETGIAHGGSLMFYASMMELLHKNGIVIGIDIDIRKHNRLEIEKSSVYHRIRMIEGSSIDKEIVDKVKEIIQPEQQVLVALDSCHTHDHVLNELKLYSPLIKKGSYLVCMDTVVEMDTPSPQGERPWGKGNNPMTAVQEFMKSPEGKRFVIDTSIDNKLLISTNPSGYLKCVR